MLFFGVNRTARRCWNTKGLMPRVGVQEVPLGRVDLEPGITSTLANDWSTFVPPFVVSVALTMVFAAISNDGEPRAGSASRRAVGHRRP